MADAPKINPTDTLRESYPKLNQAIDNANEAITKATSAETTANQAKSTADNVQAQFNQVVIEGDSSVEAAQARVDADGNTYTTLKERLDTKEQSFSAQLAQTEEELNTVKSLVEKPIKEKMVYYTEFTNTDGWDFLMTDGVETEWIANNNQITTPSGIKTDSVAFYNGVKPTDFRLGSTITGEFTNWFGVAFRVNNLPSRPEGLAVIFFPNNKTASLWKFKNNNLAKLSGDLNLNRPDIDFTKGLTVEIEVTGDNVTVFVNDARVGTLTHNELRLWKKGFCGLISSKDNVISYSDFNIFERQYNTIELYNVNKVICVGSSITNGFGATKGWRVRFKEKLSNLLSKDVNVINGGINGSTTSDMLNRLPNLIISNRDADICFIEASINDCKVTGNIPIETTIQNLTAMIRMCKENGIIPILMTATPVNPNIGGTDWSNDSWQQIREMNNLVRRLAFEENIKCVDNAFAFGRYPYAEKIAMIPDGLHPNDDGSEVMANEAMETLTA